MFQNYSQKKSGGIPYPHQLGGTWQFWNTDPNIADADRSVLSWTRPSDVAELVLIGVDCPLFIPNVLGGEVTFVPETAGGADGVVTDDKPS